MKNFIIIVYVMLLPIIGVAQSKVCVIKGYYLNKKSGMVELNQLVNDKYKTTKAIIKNGNFTFQKTISEPTEVNIDGRTLWIEPHMMYVAIDSKRNDYIFVKGSKTQTDFEYYNSMKSNTMEERLDNCLNFISKNHKSYISAEALYVPVANGFFSVEKSDSIYKTLAPNVQKSYYGKEIAYYITLNKKTLVGKVAPYWEAKERSPYWLNKDDKQILSLNDFKGKVVLMDFWASWCIPCRKSIREFKPHYKELADSGLVVIAVNSDPRLNVDEWKKAMAEDSTEMWHHVFFTDIYPPKGRMPNSIYSNYNDHPIPLRILIDKKGIIRGKWTGYLHEGEEEINETIRRVLDEK